MGNGKRLAAIVAAVLLWSASFVGTKVAYLAFAPMACGMARFAIAGAVLLAVCAARHEPVPRGRDMGLVALSGLLGITAYFAFENMGVSLMSAGNTSLVVASFPAITVLLELAVYRVRPSTVQLAGVLVAFSGVALIVSAQDLDANPGALVGSALLVCAGVVWAFYNFTVRRLAGRVSSLAVTCWQSVLGTAMFAPLVIAEGAPVGPMTWEPVAAMAFLALGCSVAAYFLYNWGLEEVPASTAVSIMNLVPVFGLFFSWLVLGEPVTWVQVAGGTVVIAGVMLSARGAGHA